MNLPKESPLYEYAVAGAKVVKERLSSQTRRAYDGALDRFKSFCIEFEFPDPLVHRFPELPCLMVAYMQQQSNTHATHHPAEKLRSAISDHYMQPEMAVNGHPHDRYRIHTSPHFVSICRLLTDKIDLCHDLSGCRDTAVFVGWSGFVGFGWDLSVGK